LEKNHEELFENLRFLGMTRTQARVYVASLTMKYATARQIAETADLDIAVTYRRIRELVRMNLIELRLGSPNQYTAIQPERALNALLEKSNADARYRRHLVTELMRDLTTLVDREPIDPESGPQPRTAYRLLTGRDRLFEESQRLRNQTKHELLLIIPALGLRRLVRHGYVHEVTDCVRRGITVRIITEITEMNILESGQLANLVTVRHYPKISFRLGIYDRETLHIGAAYDDDPLSDGTRDVYLIISDKALANSMALLFDAIWDRSVRPTSILKRMSTPAVRR
jgi:sugar-specific transcriptional regulator TrmB